MHIMQCDQIISQLSAAVEEARAAGEGLLDACALVDAELAALAASATIEHLSDNPGEPAVHTDREGAI